MDPGEQERTEKATALAIAQAVREALVDRTLHEHTERRNQINGSQLEMAKSLAEVNHTVDALVTASEQQLAVQAALTRAITDRSGGLWKRWQVWCGILGVIAAYGSMIVLVVTNHP